MRVDFRRGSIADAKDIAAVKDAVWPHNSIDVDHIAAIMAEPDRITYVADIQGQIVAFVDAFLTLSAAGVLRWEVDLLAVHPDFHRRGLAYQLIDLITSSGQDMGAVLARALVHVDNQASQATFAKCGYQPDEQICCLYISSSAEGNFSECQKSQQSGYLLSVNTMNYRGLWLENEFAPEHFAQAESIRDCYCWDVAGAVIHVSDSFGIKSAVRMGWQPVGFYQWWFHPLPAAGQP